MAEPNQRKFVTYTGLAGLNALLAQVFWPDFWLVCTSLLSITGGFYGLGYLMKVPGSRFNFFLAGATIIALANAAGILLSFIALLSVDYGLWVMVIEYAHTTVADLALAQAYTNTFAIMLWLLGGRLQRSGIVARLHEDVGNFLRDYKVAGIVLMLVVLVCQAYLLQQDVIVYGGKNIATEGDPTHPLLALLIPLIPPLPFLLGYYVRSEVRTGRWVAALFFGVLLLAELYWFFLFGRRSILQFAVFLFAGFSYGNLLTAKLIPKHIVLLGISLFFILKIADTYHKLRTVYGFENLQRMSVVAGLAGLQDVDDDQYGSVRKMNLVARSAYSSLAIGQFVNLFRTRTHRPLAGQVLMSSMLVATPSDFFVDKKDVLAKEALYETAYSLKLTDISETLCLESFIDFGWYGFLLYATFIYVLFYVIYWLASQCRNPLFSLLVGCISVSLAMSMIETDMITFLASLRVLFLYGLLTALFFRTVSVEPLRHKLSMGA